MGSVLGPTFSNLSMSDLENKVFDTINKPNIYLRYAVDLLLLINSTDEINIIQEIFQNNSVFNILTFDPAINRGTGASGRRYQGITLTADGLNWVKM